MKMILETENPRVLESINILLKKETKADFCEALPQDLKDEISLGLEDIKNGEVVDFDEIIRKHRG